MWRVYLAVAFVILIVAGGFALGFRANALCLDMTVHIQASLTALLEHGADDGQNVKRAHETWLAHINFFSSLAANDKVNAISLAFMRTIAFSEHEDAQDEYAASMYELLALIERIRILDAPTIQSVL